MASYPFDVVGFIKDNKQVVKRYLKADTYKIVVDDVKVESKDSYYLGNPILLKAGVSFEYEDIQKLEFIKCMKDVVYFTRKYIKIISIDDGIIPFDLYDYQEELLTLYQNNRHVVSLQARQSGKTQTTAAYLLHFATFNPAKNIAILANKASQAREILGRIQLSYELLPFFLKQGILTYNKGSTKFDNKSEIFCGASSSSSIRGKSISCVTGDTHVTVRNKETGEVERITMQGLESRLEMDQVYVNVNQTTLKNDLYEVLTPGGWSDFDGLLITEDRETIDLIESDLSCTPNHLIKVGNEFVRADSLPHTIGINQNVYDLLNVEKDNEYFTNDLVSHNCLYIDEAAFLRDDMEFYESTYPTISSGKDSRIIVTSTPNGARGLFYKIWSESESKTNTFANMKVTWDMVPGRDEEWKEEQIRNTSQEQFSQEHAGCFRGSQNSLLSVTTLMALPIKQPKEVYGDLRVYADPIADHVYVTVVDTSRGVGADFSAFIVFDVTHSDYEIVATYKNNRISPMLYPQMIRTVSDKYNEAYVLCEVNDIGEQVASILYHDFEYENLLMCFSEKSVQTIGFIGDARLGVRTTVAVKSIGCSNVRTMIETGKLRLYDEDVIGEFGTFIPKGRSYEADSGAHDDLVMCCVLFAWASVQPYFIDLVNRDVRVGVRDALIEDAMADLLPFGIIDDGIEEFTGDIPHERLYGTIG